MRQPIPFGIALALLVPAPASALPPPQPVNARYGPVTQCFGGYRVQVAADEALSVGQDVTLITDRYMLRLVEGAHRTEGSRVTLLAHPVLGAVERVVTKIVRPKNDGGFRVIGEKQPERPETVAYRLPELGGGPPVTAESAQFLGTPADLAILAVSRRSIRRPIPAAPLPRPSGPGRPSTPCAGPRR